MRYYEIREMYGHPSHPDPDRQTKLKTILRLLRSRFQPIRDRIIIFGGVARGNPDAGDVDIMVDCSDLSYEAAIRLPEINALLGLSKQFYGLIDVFVQTERWMFVRNDYATGWDNAKHARQMWKAARTEGKTLDEVADWPVTLTEAAQDDPRRVYRYGMCDAMAMALHALTRLPMGLWRGFFPDDVGEAGDEGYQDCHAVAVLSFNPPRWIDVDGIHEGEPDNCHFTEPVTRLELVPASAREVREAFTTERFDPSIVRRAKAFVASDAMLSRIVAEITGV